MYEFNHLKVKCAGCERKNVNFTKEHVFPKWLIKRTKTNNTGLKWPTGESIKKLPGFACTLPLCKDCNSSFGQKLEQPVQQIFNDLENGYGISDLEAELLIRWSWKTYGLFWAAVTEDNFIYTENYTLSERVLNPIDEKREDLTLGISLIDHIDPFYEDYPLGINSTNLVDAIFFAGVFSKIAIIISLNLFSDVIPDNYSLYNLEKLRIVNNHKKIFSPSVGFNNDTEAVQTSKAISYIMSKMHDNYAIKSLSNYACKNH